RVSAQRASISRLCATGCSRIGTVTATRLIFRRRSWPRHPLAIASSRGACSPSPDRLLECSSTLCENETMNNAGGAMVSTANDNLAADTTMGAVTLKVANLDRMVAYYQQGVGLDLLSQKGDIAILGRGATPTLVLQLAPEL